MRIVVTGGVGFVGSLLVDRLIGEGRRVVVFDRVVPGACRCDAGLGGGRGNVPSLCWLWTAALLLVMTLVVPSPVLAAPTLAGNTGLIKTPTARVLSEGELVFGFSWVGGPQSYLFRPKTNRMYYASMGVLPGMEVSLDMLQVIGWVDPEAPGVAWAMHRLSNVKYQLPLPADWPRIAIGAQDPLSANALSRGPVGQTDYGLTTFYGVASHAMGPVSVHLGYGRSRGFLDGAFGGADLELGYGLNVRAEYDGRQWNSGLQWQPFGWLGLQVARLFPDDMAYGASLSWRL